ncbi:MAG: hypothetical protein ACOYMS_02085 [Terrimicrobiaceae bacterium]
MVDLLFGGIPLRTVWAKQGAIFKEHDLIAVRGPEFSQYLGNERPTLARWFRGRLGAVSEAVTAELPAAAFNQDSIAELWRNSKSHKKNNSLRLWMLGCLAGWMRVHQIDFALRSK